MLQKGHFEQLRWGLLQHVTSLLILKACETYLLIFIGTPLAINLSCVYDLLIMSFFRMWKKVFLKHNRFWYHQHRCFEPNFWSIFPTSVFNSFECLRMSIIRALKWAIDRLERRTLRERGSLLSEFCIFLNLALPLLNNSPQHHLASLRTIVRSVTLFGTKKAVFFIYAVFFCSCSLSDNLQIIIRFKNN